MTNTRCTRQALSLACSTTQELRHWAGSGLVRSHSVNSVVCPVRSTSLTDVQMKRAVGGRPPQYAPAPPPCGRRADRAYRVQIAT